MKKNELSIELNEFLNEYWTGNFQEIPKSLNAELYNECYDYIKENGYPEGNIMHKGWSFENALLNLLYNEQLIKLYHLTLVNNHKQSRIWKMLGLEYYYQDMFNDTIFCLKKAFYFGINSNSDASFELLGSAYAKLGDIHNANFWFNRSTRVDIKFINSYYGGILEYANIKFKKRKGSSDYNSDDHDIDISLPFELKSPLENDEVILNVLNAKNEEPRFKKEISEIVEKGLGAINSRDTSNSLLFSNRAIEILKNNIDYLTAFELNQMSDFRKFETLLFETSLFAQKNDFRQIENVLLFALLLNIVDYNISPGFENTVEQRIRLVNKQPHFFTNYIKMEIVPSLKKDEIISESSHELLSSKLFFLLEAEIVTTAFMKKSSRYEEFYNHYLSLLNNGYFLPITNIDEFESAKDKFLKLIQDSIINKFF